MLVVTHEMRLRARTSATRTVFMDRGEIVEQGPAREVLANPREPRTQDFLRRILKPI